MSTQLQEHTILIGSYGWLHDEWLGEFYPEDLPDEWQLGYYGNEFQVVLVPADYWTAGAGAIAEWLEETDESPRFICEWPGQVQDEAATDELLALFALLGDRVMGILLGIDDEPNEQVLTLASRLSQHYALCIDAGQDTGESVLEQIREYCHNKNVSLCWHGEAESAVNMSTGKLLVARINSTELDPRTMRFIVEECIKQGKPDRDVALIFDGKPPSLQQMTNAGVIRDLL
jgi:hypothetical protein